MKISNNSSQSFGTLLMTSNMFDKAAKLSQNMRTSKDFNEQKKNLEEASKDDCVLISTYGDGASIIKYDPETQRTVKFLAKSNNCITAMKRAAEILNNEKQPKEAPRQRFPGHINVEA